VVAEKAPEALRAPRVRFLGLPIFRGPTKMDLPFGILAGSEDQVIMTREENITLLAWPEVTGGVFT